MSLNVETIKVILDINLPTPAKVYLTKNLFHFPTTDEKKGGANSNYPFFTFDAKYSTDKLHSIPGHKDRIMCFFNDVAFRRILEDQHIAKDDNDRKDNAKYNVMCMLGCMFPTYFPIENNIQGSFETKIENNFFPNQDFSFSDTQFSYIRLKTGVYTVTRALWVNDIINNKAYRDLIDGILKYNSWELKKKEELVKRVEDMQKKFDEAMAKFIKSTLEQVLQQIKKVIEYYDKNSKGLLYSKTITDLSNKMKGLSSAKKDSQVDLIVDVNKIFKNLPSEVRQLVITSEFNTIYEMAKSLKGERVILEILDNPEKKKKYEKDKDILEKLKEFSNLSEVIDIAKKYITPHRISSNKQFQNLIENFVNGGGSHSKDSNLMSFAAYVNSSFLSRKINKSSSSAFSSELLNSGVILTNLSYVNKKTGKLVRRERRIEANVKLNVFKGILTAANIFCVQRNAVLESTYKHLKESGGNSSGVEIEDQSHLYLDMTSLVSDKKGGKTAKKRSKKNNTRKRGK